MSSKETAEAILIVVKKIGKWVVLSALGLFLIFLAFYAYNQIEDYYQNRPQLVTSLKDIDLGERFEDFMFRNEGFVLDVDRSNGTKDIQFYKNKDKSASVAINDKKVVYVSFSCSGQNDYTYVNGINCLASGDRILNKYGKDIRALCLKDKNDENYLKFRAYDAAKFGIRYYLASNKVIAFVIANPTELINSDGFISTSWTACE